MGPALIGLVAGLLGVAAAAPDAGRAGDDGATAPPSVELPCPDGVARCFGVRLWVAAGADGPVVTGEWLTAQLAQANTCFEAADVGFTVVGVASLPADTAHIPSRAARDALGRARFDARVIDVYVVARLDDVDEPGEIRGVHWRNRADRARRWVILSAIAPVHVLAHELGHYFGLGHSRHVGGVMSKLPGDPTAVGDRRFSASEVDRLAARARRFARAGEPAPRPRDD